MTSVTVNKTKFRVRVLIMWTALVLVFLVRAVHGGDTNPVFNPCSPLLHLGGRDSISIAVGYSGRAAVWYNNSNLNAAQLSPCDNSLVSQMPAGSLVAVFRPLLDQISMLRTNNASYLALQTSFPGNATVVAYAGNPTVITPPRYFLIPMGRIPIYTLVVELKKGRLVSLSWKDDNCLACGGPKSDSCFEGACYTLEGSCTDPTAVVSSVKGSDPCRFAINLVFSGTDKYNVIMDSWYQVKAMDQYSLTSLFGQAGNTLTQLGASIIDDQLGG